MTAIAAENIAFGYCRLAKRRASLLLALVKQAACNAISSNLPDFDRVFAAGPSVLLRVADRVRDAIGAGAVSATLGGGCLPVVVGVAFFGTL